MTRLNSRKERSILRKNWSSLRAEISAIISKNSIPSVDFSPLSVQSNWEKIQKNIYHNFCNIENINHPPTWLWENFKLKTTSFHSDKIQSYKLLPKLVTSKERIWFFVNETINEKTKLWFYEGILPPIMKIIEESSIDEYYLVSKKHEWLICENHHEILIATGNKMANQLSILKNEMEEKLKQ